MNSHHSLDPGAVVATPGSGSPPPLPPAKPTAPTVEGQHKRESRRSCGFRVHLIGAGDGVRTRDLKLGKLVLYQLSYTRAG